MVFDKGTLTVNTTGKSTHYLYNVLQGVVWLGLGTGLMVCHFSCVAERSDEQQARRKLTDWETTAFQRLASDAEQEWWTTRAQMGAAFEGLAPEDRARPLWQLSAKYFAEGENCSSRRLAALAMQEDGKAPNGFDIYVGCVACDSAWLESQVPDCPESSWRGKYLRAAICWSNGDPEGVLRMAAPVFVTPDAWDPDAIWLTFLAARAFDALGHAEAAALAVDRVLPYANIMMLREPFRIYLTCIQIWVRAGRLDGVRTMLPGMRNSAQKFDISWAGVRQEIDSIDAQCTGPTAL
jgi:hypothetical protein